MSVSPLVLNPEVKAALNAGFESIHAYGEMRRDAPKENDIRIHYTARKPEEQAFEL